MAVAVLALAYGTSAPQLAVAEFAPSANESIEPPPTTSDTSSHASGASARSRRTTTTTVPATTLPSSAGSASSSPTTRVGRARPCYGNPPSQLEDPMSPPCLATIFEGDNGGQTSTGVSSAEIRVAALGLSPTASPTDLYANLVKAMFDYFNQRFELYGRRLVPVATTGSASDATTARALGAGVAAQSAFAAVTGSADWGTPQAALAAELARQHVITIVSNMGAWWTDRSLFDETHPYVWSIHPSSEDVQANLADFACSSMRGHPARHAGSAALNGKDRVFGVVAVGQQVAPATGSLVQALDACTGVSTARVSWAMPEGPTALQTGLMRLRDSGVTTLFCVCDGLNGYHSAMPAAKDIGFFPEWVLSPSPFGGDNDDEYGVQYARSARGIAPPIRISASPKLLPMQARPWFQALQASSPDLAANTSGAYSLWGYAGFLYEQLLVLASGIQAAGPALTPDTFAAGLMATQFPNPGAGQPPYWQPSAGFGPGDHSFYDDYSVGWWSDTAPALSYPATPAATGSWCYLGQGARFRPGSYPADAEASLFNPDVPCR